MQLSWPREGDRKRAIISRDIRHEVKIVQSKAKRFLNLSPWDILLSEELESGRISGEDDL